MSVRHLVALFESAATAPVARLAITCPGQVGVRSLINQFNTVSASALTPSLLPAHRPTTFADQAAASGVVRLATSSIAAIDAARFAEFGNPRAATPGVTRAHHRRRTWVPDGPSSIEAIDEARFAAFPYGYTGFEDTAESASLLDQNARDSDAQVSSPASAVQDPLTAPASQSMTSHFIATGNDEKAEPEPGLADEGAGVAPLALEDHDPEQYDSNEAAELLNNLCAARMRVPASPVVFASQATIPSTVRIENARAAPVRNRLHRLNPAPSRLYVFQSDTKFLAQRAESKQRRAVAELNAPRWRY